MRLFAAMMKKKRETNMPTLAASPVRMSTSRPNFFANFRRIMGLIQKA
jgi:hypothetical protein